jgi:hypothetical protein
VQASGKAGINGCAVRSDGHVGASCSPEDATSAAEGDLSVAWDNDNAKADTREDRNGA